MNLYVIRRRDFWGTPEELQKTAARSAEVGEEMSDDVRWIRSYVVQEESGKLGTVCIYEGSSAEKVREQAERTGMPVDEITLIADTVIVCWTSKAPRLSLSDARRVRRGRGACFAGGRLRSADGS